jgi:phosphate transport system substrate-binding protein
MDCSDYTGELRRTINMKRGIAAVLVFLTSYIVVISCGDASNDTAEVNSGTKGRINISVDETFKPVIEEQIKVFESSWPEAQIVASYKSEADCFRDLQNDSTTMVIVTRGLNRQETKFFKNKLNYDPRYDLLAFDAIAVIVNKSSNDSVFTIDQLSSYLKGSGGKKQIVVDGNNATSTVRYLMDSLLRGTEFGKDVVAAESSDAVIDFVAKNVNAIGMVGISWVFGRENSDQKESLNKIKTALVECKKCVSDSFFRPSQATITAGQYPLFRKLFFILKENYSGVGSNFTGFMEYERGQLIFRRAQLVPAKMVFNSRLTDISEEE